MRLSFRLLGPARALERARGMLAGAGATCRGCGQRMKQWVRYYDPKVNVLNKRWIQEAAMEAKRNAGIQGVDAHAAYELTALYWVLKPESKRRKNSNPFPFPISKPDLSNCIKLVEDALNELIWRDDAQIVNLRVFKRFTEDEPRAEIAIRVLSEDECGSPFEPRQGQMAMETDVGGVYVTESMDKATRIGLVGCGNQLHVPIRGGTTVSRVY